MLMTPSWLGVSSSLLHDFLAGEVIWGDCKGRLAAPSVRELRCQPQAAELASPKGKGMGVAWPVLGTDLCNQEGALQATSSSASASLRPALGKGLSNFTCRPVGGRTHLPQIQTGRRRKGQKEDHNCAPWLPTGPTGSFRKLSQARDPKNMPPLCF
jgi:hypothetical protein